MNISPYSHWYALKAQPKREAVAAAVLANFDGVESFCPRIRYRRKTRAGWPWVTEALFPGYLFARFVFTTSFRRVQSAQGVAGIVHFGDYFPEVPAAIITQLRKTSGETALIEVAEPELQQGDTVEVMTGPLARMEAVVQKAFPARQRIRILIDFLGRTLEAEFPKRELTRLHDHPPAAAALGSGGS